MKDNLKGKLIKTIVDWCAESKVTVQIGAVYAHPDFACHPDVKGLLKDSYAPELQGSLILLSAQWDTAKKVFHLDSEGVRLSVNNGEQVFDVYMPYSCIASVHSIDPEKGGGINFEVIIPTPNESKDILPFKREGNTIH